MYGPTTRLWLGGTIVLVALVAMVWWRGRAVAPNVEQTSNVVGTAPSAQQADSTPAFTVGLIAPATQATPVETGLVRPAPTVITPVHEGIVIEPRPWSPDGRWMPFWEADSHDSGVWRSVDATLWWVDAPSGAVCEQPGIRRVGHADDVFWTDEGQLALRIEAAVLSGSPCEPLSPVPESTFALPAAPPGVTPEWALPPPTEGYNSPGPEDSAVSPDGRFTVTTTTEDGVRFATVVTDSSGAAVVEVQWAGNGGFGDMGTGGVWLPTNEFLIGSTMDKGPLLIRIDGSVVEVAREFFGLVPSDDERGQLWAEVDFAGVDQPYAPGGALPPDTPWHMFLTGSGQARLYHPETGLSEALPSTALWHPPITPDNKWLLLRGRLGAVGGPAEGLWVGPLEESVREFRPIDAGVESGRVQVVNSPDWSRLAILYEPYLSSEVYVVAFSSGEVLSRWRLDGYAAAGARWSPDSRTLVLEGTETRPVEVERRALFVVRPGH